MLEKHLFLFLSRARRHKAIGFLTALILLVGTTAHAQDLSRTLRGAWEIPTPDDDRLVLILKGKGLASYFWAQNADRNVYQGEWQVEDKQAVAKWPDGSMLVLEKTATGFSATVTNGGDRSTFSTEARQIPQNILGQWAKPPERAGNAADEQEDADGYFGVWAVGEEETKFVYVQPDRSAASTAGDSTRGQRGQWVRQGSELHIIWDSGQYSILGETERGYTYKEVASGAIIEEDETPLLPAIRTNETNVPADWLVDYQSERKVSTGGIAFSNRKDARAFYRGDWIIRRNDSVFEKIELKRFGGLSTSADRTLGGQWRQTGQDIFMRWDDGMRKILSPVGQGFVLYEFRPGRPLDGVPTRVLALAPADKSKFEKYLAGRASVAAKMQEIASAAGVSESEQGRNGLGRTFARWAWPFDSDNESKSAEDLIDEEYAPASEDPWWWPFWSENKESKEPLSEEEAQELTEPAPREDSPDNSTEEAKSQSDREGSSGWKWPF